MKMESITRRRLLQLLGLSSVGLAASAITNGAFASPLPQSGKPASPGDNPLQTRLTQEYGVTYPFVGAGMGFVSLPPLVAAVSNAGGIGVLGAGIEPPPSLQLLIQMIK